MSPDTELPLEARIAEWREYLRRRQAIAPVDVAELEDHLRELIERLTAGGLSPDEAFLVAVKRMGALNALSREFAREHSDRLWKQLLATPADDGDAPSRERTEARVAFGLAIAAGMLVKLPSLFGLDFDQDGSFYARNLSFFVLPLLAAFFVWKRALVGRIVWRLAAAFALGAVAANVHTLVREGDLEVLLAMHLPIALWLVIGVAYTGNRWSESARRMDFIRFSGELFIYGVLLALGGGLFAAITAMILTTAGIKPDELLQNWLVPCGAAGAVLVGAWLVEAKQSVVENMAPVLTRLFAPLFAVLLVAFLGLLLVTGTGLRIERDTLLGFDALLAVVLALLLYSASARDPLRPPGPSDVVQVVLVVSALLVDVVALSAVVQRIGEFGFTPNRVAVLGENLILLVNLGWSAVLYTRFIRGRGAFERLERWQTGYLPVYAAWAACVVLLFPLIFG